MDEFTRRQLHALSRAFYDERAEAFDASRIGLPWPGWTRLRESLPTARASVLDVGCGNGRFAAWLAQADVAFDYVGTDASASLLAAARERVAPALAAAGCEARFVAQDFLERPDGPGEALPQGPFSLVALMGVLHHVPGRETRAGLVAAAADRLAPGGLLALTLWRFAGRPRFEKRRVPWSAVGTVLGAPVDEARLEAGDALLRFGDDPEAAPRYCHETDEAELEDWARAAGLETVALFAADGAQGDLNRHWIARRS
ncbi:MAG: class I SAM-dependent methyltransferase [Myxococcota bacterium]